VKNAVDNGNGFVVFIGGWVSAATAAGGQIADQESEIRVLGKRRSVMKLQRTFICIAGVFIAVGFATSQAGAGTGVEGCSAGPALMEIEVNQLRAGGKTVVTSPNDTTKVTAKARILKGTAPTCTTLDTVLVIEASISDDDGTVISSASQSGITLGVGKGGKGASLNVLTEQCGENDFITFTATFTGLDEDADVCLGERILRKPCR